MLFLPLLVWYISLVLGIAQSSSYKSAIKQRQAPDEPQQLPGEQRLNDADQAWLDNIKAEVDLFPHAVEGDDTLTVDPLQGPPFRRMEGVFPQTLISGECTAEQESIIKRAWDDAKLFTEAQNGKWKKDYDYDKTHKFWLGDDWNATTHPEAGVRERAVIVNRKIKLVGRLFKEAHLHHNQWFLWRCNNARRLNWECSDVRNAGTWAEQSERTQNIMEMTTFCESFFKLETIGGQVAQHKDDADKLAKIGYFEQSTAKTLLHEVWHYNILGWPPIADLAYGMYNCRKLAIVNGTKRAFINSDSYTFDAINIYLDNLIDYHDDDPKDSDYHPESNSDSDVDMN
ncbi:Metalloproteases (zincins), catalytic [Glarea lozoyensis ATCC 20868]|uniref:Metalloproteases (Zincins), catalytic n=1 Tax=Glarea lozoyensis (strain ATCC 20868 / MF5171) TaxID=1116229 RepID=S3DBT5_GLAL2|nr:Metalloproteases (zincins), catalytic [Glarea lozoyensis ATCC 20868]EPE24123.1 Metalloproteases (zincins), catalytic [Glarea lozoyensis ATCC 20868]